MRSATNPSGQPLTNWLCLLAHAAGQKANLENCQRVVPDTWHKQQSTIYADAWLDGYDGKPSP